MNTDMAAIITILTELVDANGKKLASDREVLCRQLIDDLRHKFRAGLAAPYEPTPSEES